MEMKISIVTPMFLFVALSGAQLRAQDHKYPPIGEYLMAADAETALAKSAAPIAEQQIVHVSIGRQIRIVEKTSISPGANKRIVAHDFSSFSVGSFSAFHADKRWVTVIDSQWAWLDIA